MVRPEGGGQGGLGARRLGGRADPLGLDGLTGSTVSPYWRLYVRTGALTLAAFTERYIREDTEHLAPTTLGERKRHLGAEGPILPHLGARRLDEITTEHLRAWWAAEITGKREVKSGREILGSLSAVLGYARECGVLAADHDPVAPMRATLRRRGRSKAGRAAADAGRDVCPIESPAEIDALVAAAREAGPETLVLVLLLLDAGLRVGEAVAVRWPHVRWAEGHLHISESLARGRGEVGPPTSGPARDVGLSLRLRDALLALYEERQPGDEDRVIRKAVESRTWTRLRESAGLPQLRPKDLRDTFASQLLTVGVQLGYISTQLGHADAAVTARHYARWIGGADYRDPLVRRPGELPCDFLARLGETAPAAPDGTTEESPAPDGERSVAQRPVGAEESWRAQHDSNMRPSGPQPDALSN